MIDTMVGLLEVCAKSGFYGSPRIVSDVENFLKDKWRIRYDEKQDA